MVLDPDAPRPVFQRKRHVVTPTDNLEVLRRDPLSELQYVLILNTTVGVVVDHIVAVTLVVHIRVAAVTALEDIVTRSAHKNVVPTLTIQLVLARSS